MSPLTAPFRIAVLAVLALAASPLSAAERIPPDTVRKMNGLFTEATALKKKKMHREAIEKFRELNGLIPAAREYDDMRAQCHCWIASLYSLEGDAAQAIAHIEKAIENGLTEMGVLTQSPDFETVRRTKEYATFPEKMRRRAEKAERERLERLRGFDFEVTAIDGKVVRKKDYLGKVLIVDVWGTWCPPCQMEIPHFIELQRRYADRGLAIVGLNSERVDPKQAPEVVKKFVEKARIPYPCAIAPQQVLSSIPDLSGFPTTLFFGRDGAPRAIAVGARDFAALDAIVKPLLEEKAPAPPGA